MVVIVVSLQMSGLSGLALNFKNDGQDIWPLLIFGGKTGVEASKSHI